MPRGVYQRKPKQEAEQNGTVTTDAGVITIPEPEAITSNNAVAKAVIEPEQNPVEEIQDLVRSALVLSGKLPKATEDGIISEILAAVAGLRKAETWLIEYAKKWKEINEKKKKPLKGQIT